MDFTALRKKIQIEYNKLLKEYNKLYKKWDKTGDSELSIELDILSGKMQGLAIAIACMDGKQDQPIVVNYIGDMLENNTFK